MSYTFFPQCYGVLYYGLVSTVSETWDDPARNPQSLFIPAFLSPLYSPISSYLHIPATSLNTHFPKHSTFPKHWRFSFSWGLYSSTAYHPRSENCCFIDYVQYSLLCRSIPVIVNSSWAKQKSVGYFKKY